ncbi:RND transporter [Halopseudomonas pachastrellae]|uniref:RND transporter n=1 Tax=Halopseudomonas pachastrellae TaxID=254161 RepID=A0A1S8DEY5_9GAMM|nr:TolC family protein [Halopseudomonas pachastrellae]ONM43541.1 RND transporter [Halopseudomonas pachastrellae]SFL80335.1 efflux transporter, outer membrane factor (OMF) lipoprotein, NodT family [Halopseudomonas pachastrellae]
MPRPPLYLLLPLALLVHGCATTGTSPDYSSQAEQLRNEITAWPAQADAAAVSHLTQLIDSDQLHQLVSQALDNNPGLQQTWLVLRQRQAEQRRIAGGRLPSASAGFQASRSEDTDSSYTGSVSVSWELDLWHRVGDEVAAAGSDSAQQQALYQSARDTLSAEVMQGWLGLIAQQRALEIEQRRLATLEQNEALVLQRYRAGLGSLNDLDSARSASASSRATLAADTQTLAQQQRALQVLVGSSQPLALQMPADYPGVITPLAELPTQTLERRPDLRAAWLAIEAESLRTRAAYKDMLPSISLQAALQDIAENPAQALLTDPLWSLLGELSAPLYQGGALRATADIAELTAAERWQAYRETLLGAVNEVSDALGQEQALDQQQAHITEALARQRNSLTQYQRRYRTGGATLLELLEVQQQTYDLEAQLDTLIYNRLTNRITLGLALGLGAPE